MNTNFKELLNAMQEYAFKFEDLCSNVFTMREIGNKTHGDMAEIAMTAFINKYLSDKYKGIHVGKTLFRQKTKEEDVVAIKKSTNESILISVKAYGEGPLQLSTDKDYTIYPLLESLHKEIITDKDEINQIMNYINKVLDINILLFIYNEDKYTCNVMTYNLDKVKIEVDRIEKIPPQGTRKYPVYKFFNKDNEYLFEVRYGGKAANALQRGIWTHTKHANQYFTSISNGEIKYTIRENLLDLLSNLMIADNETIESLRKLVN